MLEDLFRAALWFPCLVNPCTSCEWGALCILPRGHQQMHPAAACFFLPALRPFFVWRRCYSRIETPSEFKWASSEWRDASRLAEDSVSMALLRLCHEWIQTLVSAANTGQLPAAVLHALFVLIRCALSEGILSLSWRFIGLTCGVNSLSNESPWLAFGKDVYDWGLFLFKPPPDCPLTSPGLP